MKTDAEIIYEVLEGNKDSFELLVNRYASFIHKIAYGRLGDYHLAEDVVQEVLLKVYLRLSNLKELDKFKNWLYIIAVTTCIDWYRKNRDDCVSTGSCEEVCCTDMVEKKLEHNCLKEDLGKALNTLSKLSRCAAVLHFMSGYKIKEVAVRLNLSTDAVESRLRRAKQRLKNEMLLMEEENIKYLMA